MLLWLSTLALAGSPTVHVRDLDPTVVPEQMEFARERLWVNGAKVRGTRHAQLDYLAAVLADAEGNPPASLRVDERHAALRRSRTAAVTGIGGWTAVTVASIAFPPAAVPLLVGQSAVSAATLALALPAHRAWDPQQLAAEVRRQHTFATTELP